jgi:hypothetical protein
LFKIHSFSALICKPNAPLAEGVDPNMTGADLSAVASARHGSSQRTAEFGCIMDVQTMEGAAVKMLRQIAILTAVLALSLAARAAAQAQSVPPAGSSDAVGCGQRCYRVALPLGLYVQEVIEDGRYVMLEDGSVWEIRLSQRPVASSWRPGDFVQLKTIWAPVDRYEMLLAHGDNDKAEARLAGRGRAPATGLPD